MGMDKSKIWAFSWLELNFVSHSPYVTLGKPSSIPMPLLDSFVKLN